MPTNDGFDPADPLPRFLAERAGQNSGHELDEAAARPRILRASILIAAAAMTGIAVLAAGEPMALLNWGSASLLGNSQSPSTTAILSAADQVLPPAARDAPARDEIAASEPAGRDQAENSKQLPSDTLRQFQTWAAAREAQEARSEPAQPVQDAPVQDAPVQVAQDAPAQDAPASAVEDTRAPDRLVQKHRQSRSFRNARAEMRMQNYRKQARRAARVRAERAAAQAERPPLQDARAQDTSGQNAPPLPYFFGLFNN